MLHLLGTLLHILGLILILPVAVAAIYWGRHGDGWHTISAFVLPAALSTCSGLLLRRYCHPNTLDATASMLVCALAWLAASALGAIPFVVGIGSSYLDGCFEAMSGFTTTGITVYAGLDQMPRSILFWRALTQWLGGLGIISFFLVVIFRGRGAHHIFGAESHKISSSRPAPGLFNTVKILWGIYAMFTGLSILALSLEGMPIFDAVCHAFTALSTGGFSPHDSSIAYYTLTGHPNARMIEYTLVFIMMLGGMNFLVHYRVLTGEVRALWDHLEIKHWWTLLGGFTLLILLERTYKLMSHVPFTTGPGLEQWETSFRHTLFQVMSVMTTTGFSTKDIGSDFFPALAKQLFLVMMVIGGCAGSTGGGIKVLRVAILDRMMLRELFKVRVSPKASAQLVVDKKIVPDDECHRIAALFFTWMAFLIVGGTITAFFSNETAWAAFSGMFSALGNIGPCYISVENMIAIHPMVKITYIFGMLAGRLEILPVLLLFSRKAWR